MKKDVKVNGGISMGGLLQVAFIVLKLCKVIDWSWWWVLAPTWGVFTLLVVVAIISIIIALKED